MAAIRIFLAHASEDIDYTRELVACLEQKFPQADIFFDGKLKSDVNFVYNLGFEVATRPIFIVLLSQRSVMSTWVREEIAIARRYKMKRESKRAIIGVMIEECNVDLLDPFLSNRQLTRCVGFLAADCCTKVAAEIEGLPSFDEDVPDPHILPVPGGSFGMGEMQTEIMVEPFSIGKYLVTVEDYAQYLESAIYVGATRMVPDDWEQQLQELDHPVVNIDWQGSQAYCRWLTQITKRNFRLPTEAEWEKAARWDGKFSRSFPWGRDGSFDPRQHTDYCNTRESGIRKTTSVKKYINGASPCGALDMAGNVWEWTSTLFTNSPYSFEQEEMEREVLGKRAIRGGSFEDEISFARCVSRGQAKSDFKRGKIGLRIALSGIFH